VPVWTPWREKKPKQINLVGKTEAHLRDIAVNGRII
jgi:hypothetical protein